MAVDTILNPEPIDSAAMVSELRPALVRFFRRRCGNAIEAEDLAHDALLKSLGHTWSTSAQARGYIFRTAVNLWRDRGRRQSARLGSEVGWDDKIVAEASEDITPERVLLGEEVLLRVNAVLLELNERTRDVFLLNRLENLTYGEIAKTYQISVSAVEKHMIKALQAIERRVNEV
jgi:RNA polymerase sigma factor (sigma-70 family)